MNKTNEIDDRALSLKRTFNVVHPTAEYCKQQKDMGFEKGWGISI